MKKAGFILFAAFFLMFSFCSAITITKETINDVIIPQFNEPAHFKLTILTGEPGTYNIYTLTDVKLVPASSFYLNSGSNTIDAYVYPTNDLDVRGFYTFTYNLRTPSGENIENKLTVKVIDFKDTIEINSDSNDISDGKMSFYVKNNEKTTLNDIKAKFSSVFFNFETTFSLNPYESTYIETRIDKEKTKTIEAGSYIIKSEIQTLKETEKIDGKIYLGEKKGIETQEDSSGFLINTKSITKTNIGNVPELVQVVIKKDIFTRLFTSFSIDPNSVKRTGIFVTYNWNKELKPADEFLVKIRTSYVFPLLIILFAAIIVILFKKYSEQKIEIKKSVSHVKTKSGIFALKVRLAVKARKNVENVSLIDRVPAIVKIYEKFTAIKPDKIDATNRRIHWNIGNLNAGEERIFSYVIYSKVGVVGKFSLPEATAVFEKDNEVHESKSNEVFFLSEQTSRDD